MTEMRQSSIQASEQFQVISDLVTFLITVEQTTGGFLLYSSVTPAGAGVPPHRHAGIREIVLVVAGEYTFFREETILHASVGDIVDISAGEVHSFTNTGHVPGRLLVIAAPGRCIEEFFRDVGVVHTGDLETTSSQDEIARFVEHAARHGIEMLPALNG
ncbi:MAG: cupin domain-containing protein [Chloroflexi bacterium]|nr:cupin domain-containing protein [Chloroflexota bacterium]